MEERKYKIYIKVGDNYDITDAKTSEFVKDPENWIEAGEQTDRHFRRQLKNEYGIPLLRYVNGKIEEKTKEWLLNEISNHIIDMQNQRKDISNADPLFLGFAKMYAKREGLTIAELKELVKDEM